MKISSLDKNVADLLGASYFQVPRFQRPYSWDSTNVEEFFKDCIVESTHDYFIGSVVLYKDSTDHFGIVDGQQRITTITILLAALRNAFAENRFDDLALGVQSLIERPDRRNQKQYVLRTETSYPYFQEYVQSFGVPEAAKEVGDEELRIEEAFLFLTKQLRDIVKAIASDPGLRADVKRRRIERRLSEIRDQILSLKLIVIELDNQDDAYLIFETLNTRGKDLEVSDLVKNHLTRSIKKKNKNVDITADKWNAILERFDASQADLDVNRFLHHFWLSRQDYTTEKRLFKAIKQAVTPINASQFLDDLVNESVLYRQIYEPSIRKWRIEELGIRSALEALNLFGVRQQLPLVLTLLRNYQRKRISLKQLRDAVELLESFYFLYTAVADQRPTGGFGMMLAKVAREIENAADGNAKAMVIAGLRNKFREIKPAFKVFQALFGAIYFSSVYTRQKKLVQYILRKISQTQAAGTPLDLERLTVEHIASQSEVSKGGLSELKVAELGNLILINVDANSETLGNKAFGKKRPLLLKLAPYEDADVAKASSWGEAEITNRTNALAKLAYETIWKV